METNPSQSAILDVDHSLFLRRLNERNQQFWLEQSELFSKQFSIETVRTRALEILRKEAPRVPLKNRQTLESAADDAYQEQSRFRREFSQKGGQAIKEDFLSRLIQELVLAQPNLSQRQLFHKLRQLESEGNVKLAPDGKTITFFYGNGKSKTIPVSGLKDRLFRAKKKRDSR